MARLDLFELSGTSPSLPRCKGPTAELSALLTGPRARMMVPGRREWVPGKDGSTDINTSRKRGFKTKIIPRDLLQSTLLAHVQESEDLRGRISVRFNAMCTRVGLSRRVHVFDRGGVRGVWCGAAGIRTRGPRGALGARGCPLRISR